MPSGSSANFAYSSRSSWQSGVPSSAFPSSADSAMRKSPVSVASLEDFEPGAPERVVEFGGAEVAVLAVAEALEERRRQEPAQGAHGGAEPLGGPQLTERPDHARRPPVGQEHGVHARPERAPA